MTYTRTAPPARDTVSQRIETRNEATIMRINLSGDRYATMNGANTIVIRNNTGIEALIHRPRPYTPLDALTTVINREMNEAMDRHPAGRDTVSQLEVNLCEDCISYDANGASAFDPEPLPFPKPMSLLDGYLIGPNETDHECEGHFSWSPCDGCGNDLGGTRYCYVAVTK